MAFYVSGQENSKWLVVDSFDVVIHIFHPEIREFYRLEDLWGDASKIKVSDKTPA
ncbi:MAG: RsfS/YbeB/iojap family protein [bacterium]